MPRHTPESVWVLSHHPEPAERLMSFIEALPSPPAVRIAASAIPTSEFLPHAGYVSAAVFILDPEALEEDRLHDWVAFCIREVGCRPDFRLLVHLEDLTLQGIRQLADEECSGKARRAKLLADLLDSVQVSEWGSPQDVVEALADYLRSVRAIRALKRWRQLRLTATLAGGQLASSLQIFCAVVLIACFVARLTGQWNTALAFIATWPSVFLGLLTGLPLPRALASLLYYFTRGMAPVSDAAQARSRDGHQLLVFGVVVPAAIGTAGSLHVTAASIALGLVSGLVCEILRRNAAAAR